MKALGLSLGQILAKNPCAFAVRFPPPRRADAKKNGISVAQLVFSVLICFFTQDSRLKTQDPRLKTQD
jgi:hypothetical protein